jgi:hypothetical protein
LFLLLRDPPPPPLPVTLLAEDDAAAATEEMRDCRKVEMTGASSKRPKLDSVLLW